MRRVRLVLVTVVLGPSLATAWAAAAGHDNGREPHGRLRLASETELARLYDLTVVGVSNVGRLTAGPWGGRRIIGSSLAVGTGGAALARGPYGEHAEALVFVEVTPRPPIGRGTSIARALESRGYQGP